MFNKYFIFLLNHIINNSRLWYMDHSFQNLESNQIIVHNTIGFFIKATSVL